MSENVSQLRQKLEDMEKHYGLDKVSDRLLIKIARHRRPNLIPERIAALVVIFRDKLPIPVPKRNRVEEPY